MSALSGRPREYSLLNRPPGAALPTLLLLTRVWAGVFEFFPCKRNGAGLAVRSWSLEAGRQSAACGWAPDTPEARKSPIFPNRFLSVASVDVQWQEQSLTNPRGAGHGSAPRRKGMGVSRVPACALTFFALAPCIGEQTQAEGVKSLPSDPKLLCSRFSPLRV